ncbi:MAG: superoxide dismutase [Bacteroidota bacterium]|nr:superoxide dismutase [Bacteroidota bacterium]
MSFKLPKLHYSYNSLEPHIDARTMEIHHTKHHAGYTAKLNAAIADTPLAQHSIEEILSNLDMSNAAVRNNGGGFYNHCLFWRVMSPVANTLSGALAEAINRSFGSFDQFKVAFSTAAATQFGSGWAWLCAKKGGDLEVCSTPNQDNPLMPGVGCDGTPILGIDVWEHAYYLNYQNRRPDYIDAFFSVINWKVVAENFETTTEVMLTCVNKLRSNLLLFL